MADLVRITVIGDEKVGKTSLITTAATESCPDHPPPLLPPTKLPPEATVENRPVLVTDTSSRPEDRQSLDVACCQADVIILLFDTGKLATLRRVGNFWLPHLQQLDVQCPVILCGCKSDLNVLDQEQLQEHVMPIMMQYKQIESCLECSAKKLLFTGEVFAYAVKAVVNPKAPLFDVQALDGEGEMRDLCVRALRRVFSMCDLDQDGVLSDDELNNFQIKCFSAPLQPEELSGVKAMVASKLPQGVELHGLTLAGFLFLHALFLDRGRLETTWAVLRKFGYDNSVHLHDDILDSVSFSRAPDQGVELSEAAVAFLTRAMQRCDEDEDGALSPCEQALLFATAPEQPWQHEPYSSSLVESNGAGHPTLQGCMGHWRHMAATEPREALANILYLGYEGEPGSLFCITRPRRQERRPEQVTRTVFKVIELGAVTKCASKLQCLVLGPDQAGKTTLLRALVGKTDQRQQCSSAVATVPIRGAAHVTRSAPAGHPSEAEMTLIARELGPKSAEQLLARPRCSEELAGNDLAAFVFDSSSPESFREAHLTLMRVAEASGNTLPCVFLAAKDDLAMPHALQEDCGAVCAKLRIQPPIGWSRTDLGQTGPQMLHAAMSPSTSIPETPSLQVSRQHRRMLRSALIYTGLGAVAGLTAYGMYYAISQRRAAASKEAAGSSAQDAQLQNRPAG